MTSLASPPPANPVTPSIEPLLSDVDLFSTPQALYLVGSADGGMSFRILTLDRIQSQDERLVSSQDRRLYTASEKAMFLGQLKKGHPNIRHLSSGHGVIGFVRFTQATTCTC